MPEQRYAWLDDFDIKDTSGPGSPSQYIEVWSPAGELVSRHTKESEAIQASVRHAIAQGYPPGNYAYEFRTPNKRLTIKLLEADVVAKGYGVLAPGQGGDTTPPTEPQNFQGSAVSATENSLTWDASTDDVGVVAYQVYRDSVPIDENVPTNSFNDTGLAPSTQYSYEVAASDAAGNQSTRAGPVLVTTDANSAPVWSLGDQSYDVGEAVNIALDSFCTDADGDTLTYSLVSGALPSGLSLSGARSETLSGTVDTAETANFTLRADDGLTTTDNALTFTVSEQDVTPPDPPSAPTIDSFTSSTITLGLPTSGAGDHASYTVQRSTDGTNFGNRATGVTTSTWQDSGLSSSTEYWYRLVDVDTSGNSSSPGSSVSQTTSSGTTISFDVVPATTTTLAYEVRFGAGITLAATCAVRYREVGVGTWSDAAPCQRIRTDWANRTDGFAGMVFFLSADTDYELEATVTDGAFVDVGTTTMSTRAAPRTNPTTPNTVNVSTTGGLASAVSSAAAGDVIVLANGTYDGTNLNMTANGTAANPIILRGESRDGVTIQCSPPDEFDNVIPEVTGDYWILEKIHWESTSSNGGPLRGLGCDNLTVRRCKLTGYNGFIGYESDGIVNSNWNIYDNIVVGTKTWQDVVNHLPNGSNAADGEFLYDGEGLSYISGHGHEIYQNTISGFGDSLGVKDAFAFLDGAETLSQMNRGIVMRNNNVLFGGDDLVEFDDVYSHCAAYQNLAANTANMYSCQPNRVHGGPRYFFQNIGVNLHGGNTGTGGGSDVVWKLKSSAGGTNVIQPGFICNNTVYLSTQSQNDYLSYTEHTGDGMSNVWMLNNVIYATQPRSVGVVYHNIGGDWRWRDYNAYGVASGPTSYNDADFPTAADVDAFAAAGHTQGAPFNITRGVEQNSFSVSSGDLDASAVVMSSSFATRATGGDIVPALGSALIGAGFSFAQLSQDDGSDIGARTRGSSVPTYGNTYMEGEGPSYIAEMADYDVRLMQGTYAPTNGTSDMRSVTPSTPPRDWVNSDPAAGGYPFVVSAWSGGFKSLQGTKLFVHGGGHNDSANHGIYEFDFSGTTAPTGWRSDIDISTTANAAAHVGTAGLDAEGHPVSVHTYDGAVFSHVSNAGYRFGGSVYSGAGTFRPWSFRYDFGARSWSTLTDAPILQTEEIAMTLYDPTTNKILVLGSTGGAAFLDCNTDTWSASKTLNWPSSVGFDSTGAYDWTRGTGIIVGDDTQYGGASSNSRFTIDFSAETVSQQNQNFSGLPTLSAPCVVFDSVADVYWVIGGGGGSAGREGNWSTIYSIDPVTFAATAHSLSQSIPNDSSAWGSYGRIALLGTSTASWRAIGIVGDADASVAVIKLPDTV